MPQPALVTFRSGDVGEWQIERIAPVVGDGLATAERLTVGDLHEADQGAPTWILRGFTSNERYVERAERSALTEAQQPLGRPLATRAALISIRKSAAWWDLTQDERRAIFEQRSRHIAVGLEYLPAVARRLHHCRDLGEPFDFLTWFEFAPTDTVAFDELVERLRETEEWSYVDREVDIRLTR
jgi:chlorite dismutase